MASTRRSESSIQGSRIPEITLSVPIVLGLMVVFLLVGAGLTFFALQQLGGPADEVADATTTNTPTATLSPTPETPTPTWTPQASPTPLTYVVQEGDNCGSIATIFGISINAIILENSLSANCAITENQELRIPAPTPTATPQATSTLSGLDATIQACETDTYVVQEDDSLSIIAEVYGVPLEAIIEYNGLVSDTAFLGQRLTIPLCERVFIGGATVTPSPAPPYPAPEPLLPLDGEAFTLADDSVSLQWSSVGTLRDNEAYQVSIVDITSGEEIKLTDEVRDTKYLVPESFRPSEARPHVFRWDVVPVAQVGVDDDGNPVWIEGGPRSVSSIFTWSGSAPVATPTP